MLVKLTNHKTSCYGETINIQNSQWTVVFEENISSLELPIIITCVMPGKGGVDFEVTTVNALENGYGLIPEGKMGFQLTVVER